MNWYGLRKSGRVDDTFSIPTGKDTPSSKDDNYFHDLPLSIVVFFNHKVSTLVESYDRKTVVETDVYVSHDSNNVRKDATIGDTV